MSESVASRTVTIVNPQGLHARPARLFVQLANSFDAEIRVVKDGESADGKSILQILTLAAEQGAELGICATGREACRALEALAELVQQGFSDDESAEAAEHANQHRPGSADAADAETASPSQPSADG